MGILLLTHVRRSRLAISTSFNATVLGSKGKDGEEEETKEEEVAKEKSEDKNEEKVEAEKEDNEEVQEE